MRKVSGNNSLNSQILAEEDFQTSARGSSPSRSNSPSSSMSSSSSSSSSSSTRNSPIKATHHPSTPRLNLSVLLPGIPSSNSSEDNYDEILFSRKVIFREQKVSEEAEGGESGVKKSKDGVKRGSSAGSIQSRDKEENKKNNENLKTSVDKKTESVRTSLERKPKQNTQQAPVETSEIAKSTDSLEKPDAEEPKYIQKSPNSKPFRLKKFNSTSNVDSVARKIASDNVAKKQQLAQQSKAGFKGSHDSWFNETKPTSVPPASSSTPTSPVVTIRASPSTSSVSFASTPASSIGSSTSSPSLPPLVSFPHLYRHQIYDSSSSLSPSSSPSTSSSEIHTDSEISMENSTEHSQVNFYRALAMICFRCQKYLKLFKESKGK